MLFLLLNTTKNPGQYIFKKHKKYLKGRGRAHWLGTLELKEQHGGGFGFGFGSLPHYSKLDTRGAGKLEMPTCTKLPPKAGCSL